MTFVSNQIKQVLQDRISTENTCQNSCQNTWQLELTLIAMMEQLQTGAVKTV